LESLKSEKGNRTVTTPPIEGVTTLRPLACDEAVEQNSGIGA
jgi:hypothetical protein